MSDTRWELLDPNESTDELKLAGRTVRAGDRVRLHPRPRGDVFDLALAGQTARVESVVQELEGKFHVVVLVDSDPGNGIGPRGPGHRFFFAPEEVELLEHDVGAMTTVAAPSILVAGIGNIFLADDGFGVEVAQRLARRKLPAAVRVGDYGIRGYDLAYALVAGYEHTILVDACPRGEAPGTVFVIEPDVSALAGDSAGSSALDAHDMNPMNVLRLAQAMGAPLEHVLVVGCEPATLGPAEGHLGLSEPVEAAVDEAVSVIESIVARLLGVGERSHPAPASG